MIDSSSQSYVKPSLPNKLYRDNLNLRSKSVGETSNLLVTCQECNQENPLSIDLATIELQFPDEEVDSNVMLSNTVGVLLKYPTVDMLKYVDIDIGEIQLIKVPQAQ